MEWKGRSEIEVGGEDGGYGVEYGEMVVRGDETGHK